MSTSARCRAPRRCSAEDSVPPTRAPAHASHPRRRARRRGPRAGGSPRRGAAGPVFISGLPHSGPPDGLTTGPSPRTAAEPRREPERVAQDQLLGRRRRARARRPAPLRALLTPGHRERVLRRERRAGTARQVARTDGLHLDAMVDALDPHRPVAHLLGLALDGEDEAGRGLADRRQVALAQRAGDERRLLQLGSASRPCAPACRGSSRRRRGCAPRPRRGPRRRRPPSPCTRSPAAPTSRCDRARATRDRRGRAAGSARASGCPPSTCRSRRRSRCRTPRPAS